MPIESLFIWGAGGHASVVLDAASLSSDQDIQLLDDDPEKQGRTLWGHPILGVDAFAGRSGSAFHIAIGDGAAREAAFSRFKAMGGLPKTVTHPVASIASSAEIGQASFFAAGCVVGPGSVIGTSVIVNHNAVVDHDCHIGAFSHVAPGVILGGNVRIGRRVLVGAGSTILPGVRVGDGAVIGAGSTVIRDVAEGDKMIMAFTRKS